MVMVMDKPETDASSQHGRRAPRGRTLPYLQAWRASRYMTQVELADRAGVSRSMMARAERGNEVVSFGNIRKIADALGVSPDDLQRAPDDRD